MSTAIECAVCVDNDGYAASLELHKIYEVLPDPDAAQDGDLRIVDESGEDYLFPAKMFCANSRPRTDWRVPATNHQSSSQEYCEVRGLEMLVASTVRVQGNMEAQ